MAEPTDEQLREAERQCYEECGRRGFAVSSRWVRERALRIAERAELVAALERVVECCGCDRAAEVLARYR